MSAKNKFINLQFSYANLPEGNLIETEQKIQFIQNSNISYSYGWLAFWIIFFFWTLLAWIFSILICSLNYSKRKQWKQNELIRLRQKLNTLNIIKIENLKVYEKMKIENENNLESIEKN